MITRRTLLKLLLATPTASLIDYEQLLWVPKPIIVVPRMPTVGGINRATYMLARNQVLYQMDPNVYLMSDGKLWKGAPNLRPIDMVIQIPRRLGIVTDID